MNTITAANSPDPVLIASDQPNMTALIEEYQRCYPYGMNPAVGGPDRATNVRFNLWADQNAEGTKPDNAKSFPWPRASDARVFLADEVINEDEAIFMNSFWRALAMMQVTATDANEQEAIAYIHKLLTWLTRGRMRRQIWREARYYKQWRQHYGWVVMQVDWERKTQNKYQSISMETVFALAQSAPPESPLAFLPEMILDPEMESQAIEFFQQFYNAYVQQEFAELEDSEVPEFSRKRAAKAVRDLRKMGKAKVPVPYVCKNEPCLIALEPYVDVALPTGATDIQETRSVFRVEWISETDLRQRQVTHGYDEAWVEAAVLTRGKSDYRQQVPGGSTRGNVTLQTADQSAGYSLGETQTNIQVIHAYVWCYDEDNVPALYCTTFSPHVGADHTGKMLYAKHQLIDYPHGKRPFVHGKREYWSRELCASRGVPEVVQPAQRIMKTQIDAAVDLASISVLPPINIPANNMGVNYAFGPGAQNPQAYGQSPEFMKVPTVGLPVAMELYDRTEARVDNYFGRMSKHVPPARAQNKQQLETQDDLIFWTEVFEQVLQLAIAYLPEKTFVNVTGVKPDTAKLQEGVEMLYDFFLTMDVRDLDPELMGNKLKAIAEAAAFDRGGITDYNKLLKTMYVAIDPSLAQRITKPAGEASRQMLERVRDDFAQMALGNEAIYDEHVNPSASMELQMAQELVKKNPQYQQQLQVDQNFQKRVQNWVKNKQQSMKQQENRSIGRSGVKPLNQNQ